MIVHGSLAHRHAQVWIAFLDGMHTFMDRARAHGINAAYCIIQYLGLHPNSDIRQISGLGYIRGAFSGSNSGNFRGVPVKELPRYSLIMPIGESKCDTLMIVQFVDGAVRL